MNTLINTMRFCDYDGTVIDPSENYDVRLCSQETLGNAFKGY